MGFTKITGFAGLLTAGFLFTILNTAILAVSFSHAMEPEEGGEHWIGISAFGIQSPNFQGKICNTFLKSVLNSPNPATAVLYNTFGNDNTCLVKFWERTKSEGKTFITQFHFSNEAGRRANNLDQLDFQNNLDIYQYNELLELMPKWFEREIKERVAEILLLTEGYEEHGSFILSAGLEDNYTLEAWNKLYPVLRSAWPYQISRNIALTKDMRKQKWIPNEGIMVELHGYKNKLQTSQPCIANGDGQDVNFLYNTGLDFTDAKAADITLFSNWLQKAREKKCVTFLWTSKWQGWFKSTGATKPLDRKFQFHTEDIPAIASILDPSLPPVALPVKGKKKRKAR